jgi:hypothetical protein
LRLIDASPAIFLGTFAGTSFGHRVSAVSCAAGLAFRPRIAPDGHNFTLMIARASRPMGDDDSISIRPRSYRRCVLIAVLAVAGALAWIAPWRADAESPADNGRGAPLRIAVVILAGEAQDGDIARDIARDMARDIARDMARDMAQGITANLERGGRFAAIDSANLKEQITDFNGPPSFADWRAIDVQVLVIGRTSRGAGDKFDAGFRLWDVIGGAQLLGQLYVTSIDNRGAVADHISEMISERLIGKRDQIK